MLKKCRLARWVGWVKVAAHRGYLLKPIYKFYYCILKTFFRKQALGSDFVGFTVVSNESINDLVQACKRLIYTLGVMVTNFPPLAFSLRLFEQTGMPGKLYFKSC
ncbi:hypothetical protein A3841_19290 [Pontibacter flavimaris]|uniref:Uncharacterized protein n=1 Tax=Pontibacter flavimaris TaxID=1797110 RepID=A0A1Q5PDX3_9BACT|nr:hypothetical protein A3841_19290 [Pontibacter flavimaris]